MIVAAKRSARAYCSSTNTTIFSPARAEGDAKETAMVPWPGYGRLYDPFATDEDDDDDDDEQDARFD